MFGYSVAVHDKYIFMHRLHVVFGHVVSGQQYVTEMENQKVDTNHRPYADIRISNCGEMVLMRSELGSMYYIIVRYRVQGIYAI